MKKHPVTFTFGEYINLYENTWYQREKEIDQMGLKSLQESINTSWSVEKAAADLGLKLDQK